MKNLFLVFVILFFGASCTSVCALWKSNDVCTPLQCEHGYFNNDICQCVCQDLWSGSTCDECPLKKKMQTCLHGGRAVVKPKDKCYCECDHSWVGPTCDDCHLSCKNGGILDLDNCKCKCPPRRSGLECELCAYDCGHGKLDETSCQCACIYPWTLGADQTCDKCPLNCSTHGKLNKEDCRCACNGYWNGDNCDWCPLSCFHKGQPDLTSCTCQCPEEYNDGERCARCTRQCIRGKIQDNCTCLCPGHFSGLSCETCQLLCQHGGEVDNKACTCQCTGDWTGDYCEICGLTKISCLNNGTVRTEDCTCICPPESPWTGRHCEICSRTCNNRGVLNRKTCTCSCDKHWAGLECKDCNRTCSGHGRVQPRDCTCVCDPYRTGTDCETCTCANSGKPVYSGNNCSCACIYPFDGSSCLNCVIQCQNGGSRMENSCGCNCVKPWGGQNCTNCTLISKDCGYGTLLPSSCSCNCGWFWTGAECVQFNFSLAISCFFILLLLWIIWNQISKRFKPAIKICIFDNSDSKLDPLVSNLQQKFPNAAIHRLRYHETAHNYQYATDLNIFLTSALPQRAGHLVEIMSNSDGTVWFYVSHLSSMVHLPPQIHHFAQTNELIQAASAFSFDSNSDKKRG